MSSKPDVQREVLPMLDRPFHTTALRAPTRQALLVGRNHHSIGMAVTTEVASSARGYSFIGGERMRIAMARQ